MDFSDFFEKFFWNKIFLKLVNFKIFLPKIRYFAYILGAKNLGSAEIGNVVFLNFDVRGYILTLFWGLGIWETDKFGRNVAEMAKKFCGQKLMMLETIAQKKSEELLKNSLR